MDGGEGECKEEAEVSTACCITVTADVRAVSKFASFSAEAGLIYRHVYIHACRQGNTCTYVTQLLYTYVHVHVNAMHVLLPHVVSNSVFSSRAALAKRPALQTESAEVKFLHSK